MRSPLLSQQKGENRPLLSTPEAYGRHVPQHLEVAEKVELEPVVIASIIAGHRHTTFVPDAGQGVRQSSADISIESPRLGSA
jgi:hypothetical protein